MNRGNDENHEPFELNMRSRTYTPNLGILVAGIMIMLFALSARANSQEMTLKLPDTTSNWQQKVFSDTLFPRLSFLPPQPLGLLYQPSALPSQSLFWTFPEKIDLVSPWKLQLADQNKNKTWRTILGSVGFGGAAYIAYQHIKKYGLK
jgi:hypothetical protein